MSGEGKKIAVGVFCADWRLHQDGVHINNAVKNYLGVDAVDVIALPGPDSVCVAEEFEVERAILTKWLKLLVRAHHPITIVFVAHYNCAGHPVEEHEHDFHVKHMMETYKEALGFQGEMVALCATYTSDNEWPLKEIARIPREK